LLSHARCCCRAFLSRTQFRQTHPPRSGRTTLLSRFSFLREYFQIQDDFLDFGGTPEQIGKIGTNIIDNKCSWVINTAIKITTPEQLQILTENYGRKDPAKENRVKEVFEQLGIRDIYVKYEEMAVASLKQKISEIKEVEGGLKTQVSWVKSIREPNNL